VSLFAERASGGPAAVSGFLTRHPPTVADIMFDVGWLARGQRRHFYRHLAEKLQALENRLIAIQKEEAAPLGVLVFLYRRDPFTGTFHATRAESECRHASVSLCLPSCGELCC
jgi:hypothetical protein